MCLPRKDGSLSRKEVIRIITQNTKSLPDGYTNEQWQLDFEKLRLSAVPSENERMVVPREVTRSQYQEYHGDTQYQYYCRFINDILANIRRGRVDYCFYIYQVAELLRFEQNRLQATWLEKERCFRLSLRNRNEK